MRRLLAVWAALAALAACGPRDLVARAEANWARCEAVGMADARMRACSSVISHEATSPERRAAAFVLRGAIRASQGQHARALADFGRALRIDRDNAHALLERGSLHHERGAYEVAVRDYDAALALDPTLQLAHQRRQAAVEGRVQAWRDQVETLTQSLARDPENVELLNNRCWVRAVNGEDLEAALADCDAALRIEPKYAAALDSRGLVRLKRGEYEAALADYEAALAVEPERGHYRYGRGLARLRLGMLEEGKADLEAAESAEPGVTELYQGYGATPS